MKQFLSKIDPVEAGLAILAGIFVILQYKFLRSNNYFWGTGASFFTGLYSIHNGRKKVRQAQEQHKKAVWYKQPGILVGIAMLFGIPIFIIEYLKNTFLPGAANLLNASENIILAAFFIFFVAAAYFFIKDIIRALRFEDWNW